MKKLIFTGMLLCAAVAYAAPVYAATASGTGFVPLAGIPGLTTGIAADQAGLQSFLTNLYFYLIGVAAIIAVFQIARGGVLIAMGKDSISKQLSGKGLITQSLLGLVLILSPAIVFSVINPEILNLSVNIPPLLTSWTTWAPPPTAPNNTFTATNATQTCQTGSNTSSCVASLIASCEAVGGSPQNTGEGSGQPSITCVTKNQNTIPISGTITAQECAQLVGHGSPGAPGLQPYPTTQTTSCGASDAGVLKASLGYTYCKDLTGGGVCLYNQ